MFGKLIGSFFGPVGAAIGGVADDAFSDKKDRKHAQSINDQNYMAQKEFAQKGIQWRAEDAKAAGLHPMAALGSAGASFTPSFQTFTGSGSGGNLFDTVEGQNTGRAARAGMSDQDRELHALAVRRGQLENQLLEGQITQLWSSIMGQPSNPPAPGPGVSRPPSKSGQVVITPSQQESSKVGDPGSTAGHTPAMRPVDIAPGASMELINPDIAEALEGYGILQAPIAAGIHAYRGTRKAIDRMRPPAASLLPPTHEWKWSLSNRAWVPVRKSESRSGPRRDTPAAAARNRFRGGATGSW